MLSWVIIGALVVIAFIFVKYKEMRHRSGIVILLIVAIFIIATMAHVYSSNPMDLTTFDGVVAAGKIYFSWLGSVVHNLIKIGGYAIKQDWGVNLTNITK